MKEETYLSIIIPAYKESRRIGVTLLSLQEYFKNKDYGYEIIVVNDGSPDETAEVVQSYIPEIKGLRLIDNKKNKGKGHAVKCGMLESRGYYRLFMDADNSVSIDHLEYFLSHVKKGFDVVIGSIALEEADVTEHNGWHRRFFGSISKFVIRNLATPGIYDTQRGFKLFTAYAADIIFPKQTIERFGFDIELLVIARTNGLQTKELPVVWDNPDGSTVTGSDYFKTFVELFYILSNKILGNYKGYLRLFDKETEARVGKGFTYKDKHFIHHSELHHNETAFYNLLQSQKIILVDAGLVFFIALAASWHATIVFLISLLTILYFIDLLFNAFIIYRSLKGKQEIQVSKEELLALSDHDLPMYTIFCPLYKEWQVAPQFIQAMNSMDYPKEKLQIIFLLEENDRETIEKIADNNLEPHYEIIVVPHSMPKTKPKAMNYGLRHVTGEYLVIYDAEDVPEIDQLKKAVISFRKVNKQIICIQAKLNFYNPKQNLLTRIFTAEYSLWFDLVLPGLQSLNAPIPLGGTSNHFKTRVLREVSGWDAFNVTEDCDLGIRLAKRGYRTAIVESTTYEEANSDILNWYNQRSRWIKGYIQTYMVHMRTPYQFIKEGSIKDFLVFQFVVGGKILSMFVNPLMWLITLCYFLFRAKYGYFIESFFPGPILYIGVTSFIFGNFLYLYYYMIGCAKRGYHDLIKYVYVVPFYWLGMSIAAWKGVYEVIVKPHYWSKTVHGLHLKKEAKPAIQQTQ